MGCAAMPSKVRRITEEGRFGLTTPIHFRSEGSGDAVYHTTVSLSKPEEGEVCPITLERVADYELDFLPGVTFRKGMRDHTKMTMRCGHSFSAMALVYHLRKNSLSCPMCREGTQEKLHPACIPFHFKGGMLEWIARGEQRDRQDQEREDYEAALSLFTNDVSAGSVLIEQMLRQVDLLLYFYSEGGIIPYMMQQYSMASSTTWEGGGSGITFRLPPHYARQLRSNMRLLHEPGDLVFVLSSRDVHGHIVQLDRFKTHSNVLMARRLNDVESWDRELLTETNGCYLNVGFLRGQENEPAEIESCAWTLPKSRLRSELFDGPLAAARDVLQAPRIVEVVVLREERV